MAAIRTGSARVPRIYHDRRDTTPLRFVNDKGLELAKAPVRMTGALLPVNCYPLTDTLEFLKGNRRSGAFGSAHQGFGNSMINVPLKEGLASAQNLESALCRSGSNPLQSSAPAAKPFAASLNRFAAISQARVVGRNINDPKIYATDINRLKSWDIVDLNANGEQPFSLMENEIDFTFGIFKKIAPPIGMGDLKFLPPLQIADRNCLIVDDPENPGIERLRRPFPEFTLDFMVQLISISNFADASNNDLRTQTKAQTRFSIDKLMQIKLAKALEFLCFCRNPVATGICLLQGLSQKQSFFGTNHYACQCDKSHWHKLENVANIRNLFREDNALPGHQ